MKMVNRLEDTLLLSNREGRVTPKKGLARAKKSRPKRFNLMNKVFSTNA
jgi:hypothetical protein